MSIVKGSRKQFVTGGLTLYGSDLVVMGQNPGGHQNSTIERKRKRNPI